MAEPITPTLDAATPLPTGFRRIAVAGTSGSGKTTLAQWIGTRWNLPHFEIDALHWGPNWTPRESFQVDVQRAIAQDQWVTEFQYSSVQPLIGNRLEALVWLDFSRWSVTRRVVKRTLTRRINRTALWGGNVEPPLRTFFTDPEHVIRWAWNSHELQKQRVRELMERRPELPVVRLRSPHDVEQWKRANVAP